MRFLTIFALTFLVAACGTTPKPSVAPSAPTPPPVELGDLIGLDASALFARFGKPNLQVREGEGMKLQFAGGTCLLDAYLYPQAGGTRVVHVDTRNRDGRHVDQAQCLRMLDRK